MTWMTFVVASLYLYQLQVGGSSSSCTESSLYAEGGHRSSFYKIGACIQMLNVETWQLTEVIFLYSNYNGH